MKKILYIFLLTILLVANKVHASQYNLSVCAIFKNEAPYFQEWIEFHKLQGVEHFFLYNNNKSKAWDKIQAGAYTDCIQKCSTVTNWLAALDLDEFLFCPDGQDLPTFLLDYEAYGGVCVNWRLFGTSHLETIPTKLLMIEALTHCSVPKKSRNKRVKCIVQPRLVKKVRDSHRFQFIDNYCSITTSGEIVSSNSSKSWNDDKIRINHYWTRTESYFREVKIARRNRCAKPKTDEAYQLMADSYNEYIDTEILQFAPALREILGYD